MKKFKLFIDMTKEEQYLKEMAAQGRGLVKYSAWNIYRSRLGYFFRYSFKQ